MNNPLIDNLVHTKAELLSWQPPQLKVAPLSHETQGGTDSGNETDGIWFQDS